MFQLATFFWSPFVHSTLLSTDQPQAKTFHSHQYLFFFTDYMARVLDPPSQCVVADVQAKKQVLAIGRYLSMVPR